MSIKRAAAVATVQLENERVKVIEYRFAAGAETGWHTHGRDYVVVPVADGTLLLEQPDGSEVTARLVLGQSYTRKAGVEHNVINVSAHEVAFIEVELK